LSQESQWTSGEILVLRYFRIKKGGYADFYQASAEKIWPYYEKAGARIQGMWQVFYPEINGQSVPKPPEYDEAYLLTMYRDIQHWKNTRFDRIGELYGYGKEFDKLKEGLLVRAGLSLPLGPAGKFTVLRYYPDSDAEYRNSASTKKPDIRNDEGEILVLRYFRIQRGRYNEYYRMSSEKIWPYYKKSGARILGMWQTVYRDITGKTRSEVPDYDEGYQLTRYKNLEHLMNTNTFDKDPATTAGMTDEDYENLSEGFRLREALGLPQGSRGEITLLR